MRDNILNLRIDQENSQQSSLNSYIGAMNQVQALFNETQGTGLQTYLTNFITVFSRWRRIPPALRTGRR